MESCLTQAQYLAGNYFNNEKPSNFSPCTYSKYFQLYSIPSEKHPDQKFYQNQPLLMVKSYEAFSTVNIIIGFKNIDLVPRCIVTTMEPSNFFTMYAPCNNIRINPGLSAEVKIVFKPQECKDYDHRLVCMSDCEEFVVEIRCYGSRPVLDFKDAIDFSCVPVNYTSLKCISVTNVGNAVANFKLQTNPPFSVEPISGCLSPKQCTEVKISFHPSSCALYRDNLSVTYSTGLSVGVCLCGMAEDKAIKLNTDSISFGETYTGICVTQIISITNKSNITSHFKWTTFMNDDEEQVANSILKNKSLFMDELFSFEQKVSLEADKTEEKDDSYFGALHIDPNEGFVYPKSTVDVTFHFKPTSTGDFDKYMFCIIQGRESRLPLRVQGVSLAPQLFLSSTNLVLEPVTVSDTETYTLMFNNNGLVKGSFFLEEFTDSDDMLVITPTKGEIEAGGCQELIIDLYAKKVGQYAHKFVFAVVGSNRKCHLTIEGVIKPLDLQFKPNHVNFGVVSYGFVKSDRVLIINDSLKDVDFYLSISEIPDLSDDEIYGPIEDFDIPTPWGSVKAKESVYVDLMLQPTVLGIYKALLLVKLEDSFDFEKSISVIAESTVPQMSVQTSYINLGPFLIDYPVASQIDIKNLNMLFAKYEIDDVLEENIEIRFAHSDRIIAPASDLTIPFLLTTKKIGNFFQKVTFYIVGNDFDSYDITIEGHGVGPTVSLYNNSLDWGSIPTLETSSKVLYIHNQSPISVSFNVTFITAENDNPWSVSESEGVIDPDDTFPLTVLCYLRDAHVFNASLKVTILSTLEALYCDLSATGIGKTLLLDESFASSFEFGPFLCMQEYKEQFSIQNCGLRTQTVTIAVIDTANKKDSKLKKCNSDVEIRIEPSRMEILPNKKGIFTIHLCATKQCHVERIVTVHTVVGRGGFREYVTQTSLFCSFVEPFLSYSPNYANFIFDKVSKECSDKKKQEIYVANMTCLDIQANFCLEKPFSIVQCDKDLQFLEIDLKAGEEITLCISFDSGNYKELVSKVFEKEMTVNVNDYRKEKLPLKAYINFPNLQFSNKVIDYACILNNTAHIREITVFNNERLTVQYHWYIRKKQNEKCEENDKSEQKEKCETNEKCDKNDKCERNEKCDQKPEINETFKKIEKRFNESDKLNELIQIKPSFGTLKCGESQKTQFLLMARKNIPKNVDIICKVLQGPEYLFKLCGSTGKPEYCFSEKDIDFGIVNYQDIAPRSLVFKNKSCFHLELEVVNIYGFNAQHSFAVCPNKTNVDSGKDCTLQLNVQTTHPMHVQGIFQIRVGHFGIETFTIKAQPDYPRLIIQLPFAHLDCEFFQWLIFASEAFEKRDPPQDDPCSEKSQKEAREQIQSEAEKMWLIDQINNCAFPRVLQKYIVDFDAIIIGSEASKVVTIINKGPLPVTMYFGDDYRYSLHKQGFVVSLKKVEQICPEDCLTFEVRIFTQDLNFSPKFVECTFPLQLFKGPTIFVTIRCLFTIPELSASHNYIDMGSVLKGQCMVVPVILYNRQRVPCDWKQCDPSDLRVERVFEMLPSCGIIPAMSQSVVHVVFTPKAERKYRQQLMLKVEKSTKRFMLLCEGQGIEAKLQVVNPCVDFCAILPGQDLKDVKSIVLKNPCNFPIEVYSVEMDRQYQMEETILRLLDGYDEKDTLLLPPRQPGQLLPGELMDFYQDLVDRCVKERYEKAEKQKRMMELMKKVNTIDKEDKTELVFPEFDAEEQAQRLNEEELISMKEKMDSETPNSNNCNNNNCGSDNLSSESSPNEINDMNLNNNINNNNSNKDNNNRNNSAKTKNKKSNSDKEIKESSDDLDNKKTLEESNIEEKNDILPDAYLPVYRALASHRCFKVGMLQANAKMQRGIVLLVHGPPRSGKSTLSRYLGEEYQAVVLNVDQVLTEAIIAAPKPRVLVTNLPPHEVPVMKDYTSPATVAAYRAKQMCKAKYKLTLKEAEENKPSLQQTNESPKKETKNEKKSKTKGSKKEKDKQEEVVVEEAKIEESIMFGEGEDMMQSTPLETALVANILADRLLRPDCNRGVIFDGLDSVFTHNCMETALGVLTAVNNRNFIYAITINMGFESLCRKLIFDRGGPSIEAPIPLLPKKPKEQTQEVPDKKGKKGAKGNKDKKNKKKKGNEEEDEEEDDCKNSNALLCIFPLTAQDNLLKRKYEVFDKELPGLIEVYEKWDRNTGIYESKSVSNDDDNQGEESGKKKTKEKGNKKKDEKEEEKPLSEVKTPIENKQTDCGNLTIGIRNTVVKYSYWDKKSVYLRVCDRCFLPEPIQVYSAVMENPLTPPTLYSRIPFPTKRSPPEVSEAFYLPTDEGSPKHRWVVDALSYLTVKVAFAPQSEKVHKQSFSFQITGSDEKYSVDCVGYCGFPDVSRDPSKLFGDVIEKRLNGKIPIKKYIKEEKVFEFGAFYAGFPIRIHEAKDQDRCTIYVRLLNTSLFDVEASFSFLDPSNENFSFEPPFVALLPNEEKCIRVSAHPREGGVLCETLVCCIKQNPEPLLMPLQSLGVVSQLTFDEELSFGKTLLHRPVSKILKLTNEQALPVFWKFSDLEGLGGEFCVAFCEGIIPPYGSSDVEFTFKSPTAIKVDKDIKLEVYDRTCLLGLSQCEEIKILAEAFDVSVDVILPKGLQGCVDFGTCKVGSNNKLVVNLKNKGEFYVNYVITHSLNTCQIKNFTRKFSFTPSKGVLLPDKMVPITMTFNPCYEIFLYNQVLFKFNLFVSKKLANNPEEYKEGCNVDIDDTAIAVIPIRVSAKAVFSKFIITPNDHLKMNSIKICQKSTETFTIENVGEAFPFTFKITSKLSQEYFDEPKVEEEEDEKPNKKSQKNKKKNENKNAKSSSKALKAPKEVEPQALQTGIFNIYPINGTVAVGDKVTITVECESALEGFFQDDVKIYIENSQELHLRPPLAILYSVLVDAVIPRFETSDLNEIFEEHLISNIHCDDCAFEKQLQSFKGNGAFRMPLNKFVFKDTLVGQKNSANFKIINICKIPIEVSVKLYNSEALRESGATNANNNANKNKMNQKSSRSNQVNLSPELFKVSADILLIPPLEHQYVTVSFEPNILQVSSCFFEASITNFSCPENNVQPCRLTFQMEGDSVLPMLKVINPHSPSQAESQVNFKSNCFNKHICKELTLINESSLPCMVNVEVESEDKAFDLSVYHKNQLICGVLTLTKCETARVLVTYLSCAEGSSTGVVTFNLPDNIFHTPSVQLVGELVINDVYIDNISVPFAPLATNLNVNNSNEEQDQEKEIFEAKITNESVDLGEICVFERRTFTFDLLNQSDDHVFKFEWMPQFPQVEEINDDVNDELNDNENRQKNNDENENKKKNKDKTKKESKHKKKVDKVEESEEKKIMEIPEGASIAVTFQPSCGHIMPRSAKQISVVFQSNEPLLYESLPFFCSITPIGYLRESNIFNWDCLMKQTKWLPADKKDVSQLKRNENEKFMRKVIEDIQEPQYKVFEGKTQIELDLSVNCQYCSFELEQRELCFDSVPVGFSKTLTVELVNTSTISMPFEWSLAQKTSCPGDSYQSSIVSSMFTILPASGCVKGGCAQQIRVSFSASNPGQFLQEAVCCIPNLPLNEELPKLTLQVEAIGSPLVFEDFQHTDYLSRRDPRYVMPKVMHLDSNYLYFLNNTLNRADVRTLEFTAIGVNRIVPQCFFISNTTSCDLEFSWSRVDTEKEMYVPFRCNAMRGFVKSCKRFQMRIDYVSRSSYIEESLWLFRTVDPPSEVPVLLVGSCREPVVFLDRTFYDFKNIFACKEVSTEIFLLNQEVDECFAFEWVDCVPGETETYKLKISPSSGILPPCSSTKIVVKYTQKFEGEVKSNLNFKVQHKQQALTFKFKAQAHLVCTRVSYGISPPEEVLSGTCHIVDFEEVKLKEKSKKHVKVHNLSKLMIEYSWVFLCGGCPVVPDYLTVEPAKGGIHAEASADCVITFSPLCPVHINNIDLMLCIKEGCNYNFKLLGEAVDKGALEFSFRQYDFGPCYITSGSEPLCVNLTITNFSNETVNLQTLPNEEKWLKFKSISVNIKPSCSVVVGFRFVPKCVMQYCTDVVFVVDGCQREPVCFTGCGVAVQLKMEGILCDELPMGRIGIGECVKRKVSLCNAGPLPLNLLLCCTISNPDLTFSGTLEFNPKVPICLPACRSIPVTVIFHPRKRIPYFVENLFAKVLDMEVNICKISGGALGMQVVMVHDEVHFKACYVETSNTKTVVMANIGDYGTQFRWCETRPNVSVSPNNGFLGAGDKVTLTVKYSPHCPDERLCEELVCKIDGHSDLFLTVTGSSLSQPEAQETIEMQAPVRGRSVKTINVANPTNESFELRPSFKGPYWSGLPRLVMPPNSSHSYEIFYQPLLTAHTPFTGSLLLRLPEGVLMTYNLLGTTSEPEASGDDVKEMPCNCLCVHTIKVENSLDETQKLKMKVKSLDAVPPKAPLDFPHGVEDPIKINGLETIEVAGTSSYNYKLSIYSYVRGTFKYKVTFVNPCNKEYMFYYLTLVFKADDIHACISLETQARLQVHHEVCLRNPLNSTLALVLTSDLPITFPGLLQIPPFTEKKITVSYLPLQAEELEGKLEIESEKVATLVYQVKLKADQALPEAPLFFQVSLGSSQTLFARFNNLREPGTKYSCKTDSRSFTCNESFTSTAGLQSIEVIFEPSEVGVVSGRLEVADKGLYVFPLQGRCLPPKPMGPVSVKAGPETKIKFKNIFWKQKLFYFNVENKAFKLNIDSKKFDAKEEIEIGISFTEKEAVKSCMKITFKEDCGRCNNVTCCCCRDINEKNNTEWLYYLNGLP